MKAHFIISWLIAGLLCLWAAILVLSQSLSQAHCHHHTEQPHCGEYYSERCDYTEASNRFVRDCIKNKNCGYRCHYNESADGVQWGSISDWAMVLTTIAILVLGGFQWKTSSQQGDTQRKEIRAYVSFSINFNADKDPRPNEDYILIFNCTNRGKTPAFGIGFVGSIWPIPRPFNSNTVPDLGQKFDDSRANLFAQEGMHERNLGIKANTRKRLSQDQVRDFNEGKLVYLIGLKIRYQDVFSDWHETEEWWVLHQEENGRFVSMVPNKSRIS